MYCKIGEKVGKGEPYALLGYSMGAIAAAEVTNMILTDGKVPGPAHVFLVSHGPRPMVRPRGPGPRTDEEIKQLTIRFGGLSEQLIHSPTFWRVYLPVYRADYGLISGYNFSRLDFTVNVPATALYSPEDIPREHVAQWGQVFLGGCDALEFDGGHFFLRGHEREAADEIKGRLRQYVI